MTSPTDTFVDPSISAASGAGTIGDPYGDLQYALDQVARDGANGDRFNIKTGSEEVLTAALDLSTYGTPSEAAPVIFQGYASSQGDGGIGGINGDGSFSIHGNISTSYLHWIDLHLHNCGSAAVLSMNDYCSVVFCEIDNTTGNGIDIDNYGLVLGCHIHNIGNYGVYTTIGTTVKRNRFVNGANDFAAAIYSTLAAYCYHNIIDIDGASNGIEYEDGSVVWGNSIYSNGGAGKGIMPRAANRVPVAVANNLVEGFSGTGGVGIDAQYGAKYADGNGVYNCATKYNLANRIFAGGSDNEELTASPFVNAAAGDFTPVDIGNVKEGSLPAKIGTQ